MSCLYDLLERHYDPEDDVTWDDITDFIVGATGENVSKDTIRKGAYLLNIFRGTPYFQRATEASEGTGEPFPRGQLRELQKERVKLQTEKLEYNRWLRENARDDLLIEQLNGAIRSLPSLPAHEVRITGHNPITGTLLFGDEHFGAEFVICGLHGDVLNSYNVDIAMERMWDLLDKTIEIVKKEGLEEINVFNMGDFTDGLLRVGQLPKLQYGVVDSTVMYMEFLANWLDKLTEYVNVNFQMVHGNHSELRLLGQKKGSFKDENMGKIVAAYLKTRLSSNPNFNFTENPAGLIFANVSGFNLLGIHGECKNMAQAIKDFCMTYQSQIHFLVGGHLHHAASENVGYGVDVIRVPSLIGLDPYSLTLNKASNAGGTFLVVEEGVGKVAEYFIHLN